MDFSTAQPKPAPALCGVVSADGKIAYPPGVKEITDKITTDEMIKRLKLDAVVLNQDIFEPQETFGNAEDVLVVTVGAGLEQGKTGDRESS
ncbi:hypothetical protein J1605_018310 [Eschrichtius robustus]|uniref:Uncharacterized protein n=1 Tax=Eschrichtius robustus TaxID=9764 RepID=A0AB34HVV7_ESCRO|nr:hypothetical protein J1605_018310 [Eschrichtius robustus]